MATQCYTKRQLEDVIWKATIMALGLDDSQPEVQNRVRISRPESDLTNGIWERTENIVFLRVMPGFDEISTQHDSEVVEDEHGKVIERVSYHRAHALSWICYGPDSYNDADTIRIGLLRPDVMHYLRTNRIGLSPRITEPVNVPEPDEAGLWWDRYDLSANCYELVCREYAIGDIRVAPNVISQFE